ncbi:hypothetical protein L1987_03314 [Smallanthus sonchifolius]|uniref:Uncharacterized protein n=1 Tax=Smallanthus sonchifolius TaxID=185202 RepID=A0ACB9KAB9_9ASTR|nr:hypothetical protein L1987_03314 [Smallanthus sonchifolius]
MATSRIMILFLLFIATVTGHNITDILKDFPEFSEFNNYLTQTKLADEINSQGTITVLVFNNTFASEYLANQPLSVVKVALSIHCLLDYFDRPKLQAIGGGSMTSTTLYQTTGNAVGETGFVNITDLVGGKVGFGSGGTGSRLDALYERSVKQIPYNISVLEISSPIVAPGILKTPPRSNANITSLLEKAGCKTFANLISDTGVLKVYLTAEPRGLTVFAPTDAAFRASGLPDFGNLTDTEFISLLLYHAIPGYVPKISLMTEKNPVRTLASNEIEKFGLTVRTNGDSVTLDSGIDNSHIESSVLDSVPISIFKIDHVLLPAEYFTKPPSPAPVPVPEASPPSPSAHSAPSAPSVPSAHRPIASSPAPVTTTSPTISPPAPPASPTSPASYPVSGPAPAPSDSPTADTGSSNSSGAYAGINVPVLLLALVTGIISSIVG